MVQRSCFVHKIGMALRFSALKVLTSPTDNACMKFRTEVELPSTQLQLLPDARCMMFGSCFAEHIGRRMHDSRMPVDVNPFGVIYNPLSVHAALTMLLENSFPDEALFEGDDGMWHSRLHSGAFSAATREACEASVRARFDAAAAALSRLDVLFVTFGFARAYIYKECGQVAGNCHKQPSRDFIVRDLSPADIVEIWQPLLQRLRALRPELQVVFTVSPYRYRKTGLHGNALGKASLLLAIDELCRLNEGCHYFPAYEIVLDELRDYRFFEADMLHPSAVAIDYVWERFRTWAFAPSMHEMHAEWEKLHRALQHRPLQPDSEAAKRFREQTEQQLKAFEQKWKLSPYVAEDETARV